MNFRKTLLLTICMAVVIMAYALPVSAQSIQDAATQVEAAISEAMSNSATGNGPTLGQLGGVQAGSTASDAGGGAGGEGSSGGGGGSGGSSGGGGGCFAPETLVLMSDGTSKPIKDIKVGDKVASWDFFTDTFKAVTVLHIYTVQRDHHYVVDGISVTAEHPYCTAPGQYTEVRSLKKGTPIASVTDGGVKFIPIADFVKVDEAGTFYNMTVSDTHAYIVSPKGRINEKRVVHNKGGRS